MNKEELLILKKQIDNLFRGEKTMSEDEITLQEIFDKENEIIEKIDEALGLLGGQIFVLEQSVFSNSQMLTKILDKINELVPDDDDDDDDDDPVTSDFKDELLATISAGTPFPTIIEWINNLLISMGYYSDTDVMINLIYLKTNDLALEVKSRPYRKWGSLMQYFQDNLGDPDYFETSRYNFRNIMSWIIVPHHQVGDIYSSTDIVDDVNEGNNN